MVILSIGIVKIIRFGKCGGLTQDADLAAVTRKMTAPHSGIRARPGGWGGGTPWTHASGDAVSLPAVFSARMPRIAGCQHRGPGSAPAPPARPSPVTRTNTRVAGTAVSRR